MSTVSPGKPWDLSQVLDLVNSLFTNPPPKEHTATDILHDDGKSEPPSLISTLDGTVHHVTPGGLGDFSKLWQNLGVSTDAQGHRGDDESNDLSNKDDPRSDDMTFMNAQTTSIDCIVERINGTNGAETVDAASDCFASPPVTPLSKSQQKKLRRREQEVERQRLKNPKKSPVSKPEAVSPLNKAHTKKTAAVVSEISASAQDSLRPRESSGGVIPAEPPPPPVKTEGITHSNGPVTKAIDGKQARALDSHLSHTTLSPHTGMNVQPNGLSAAKSKSLNNGHIENSQTHQISTATPKNKKQTALVPASVKPPPNQDSNLYTSEAEPTAKAAPQAFKSKNVIEPKVVRSGEDRHWELLLKLSRDFREDRKHLVSPMNLTTHNNHPAGIHVFVDASNIFIGFMDQLKRSRGMSGGTRVLRADLSFDALALLLERRRPVAKRVLAGSTPHLPAFDKAAAVGYECSILEKVYKSRELTERQIFFRDLDRGLNPYAKKSRHNPAKGNGDGSSGSGGNTDTNTGPASQYAPPKMMEQGVDEILHLKILESIIDTDVPSTIVLATGDAAQAEYSEGFMAMAERALKKGWAVELVSWSMNISSMYTKKKWTDTWGSQFRIITLDDYAEELLDM